MTGFGTAAARRFCSETCDAEMKDRVGEVGFYQGLAARSVRPGQAILELACGIRWISLRLAEEQ